MAGTDVQLQVVISAIDNASAALKEMASNVSSSNGQVAKSSDEASSSFASLTGAVFVAEAAFRVLEEAAGTVKDFFAESIKASMDQAAAMAQVRVNVENAGIAYETLAPQIEAVSLRNQRLGFDNNDTALSLSKLVLATGDYNQALKLNELAMDLSRAKNIDLNSATVLVQQVMAGNTRVMKQYGISLDSATTSAEALNMLQGKLQGSAAAFADTSAGKLAEVQAQWAHIQETVGDILMPIFDELFQAFEANLPAITADIEAFANGVVDAAQFVKDLVNYAEQLWSLAEKLSPLFKVIGFALHEIGKAAQVVLSTLDRVLSAQVKASEASDQAASIAQKLTEKYQDLAAAYNAVNKTQITAADLQGNDEKSTKLLTVAKAALARQNGTTGSTFDDLANHVQGAEKAMVKHADAIAKAGDAYDNLKATANTDLGEMADQFTSKMKTIQGSITKTQQSIDDLTRSYNATRVSDTETVADQIVASEQKIKDLKNKLLLATTADERMSLQNQLQTEQTNYDSSLSFRQAHIAEMSGAEAKAAKTDLQRTIDAYQQKEDKEAADYNRKLTILKQTLADQQKEAQDEIDLTQAKITKIKEFLDKAQADFVAQSNARVAQTTAEVQSQIAMYNALAAAITASKSGSMSSLPTITPKVTSVHDAIITPGGGIVQTDPADYLIATKTPGSLLGSGGSGVGSTVINVTIAGGNYLDSQGATMIANELARQINRSLRVRNYAI